MKFGETLRQRSIPAWNAHNIDYDEIKYFIKDRTTPGKGKPISIAGRDDEKHIEFENALFHILDDQHCRIQLFVTSKAGEIRRRLDHITKQLQRLSAQNATATAGPISIRRLEKYSKLESEILKAGDEIRSLARFTTTQRTAFRKLLKKYKKWTGSSELETRFQYEVLNSPQSFAKLDLDPLLDDYSETLQEIRGLYETRMQQATSPPSNPSESVKVGSTPISQLLVATEGRSKVALDAAIATVPFGDGASLAHYFVHPDYAVELQVLLLRYVECYTSRSRPSTPTSPLSRSDSHSPFPPPDYYMIVADDVERIAREESAATVDEREHLSGQRPQTAKVTVRWNNQEDALVTFRPVLSKVRSAVLKRKNITTLFEASTPLPVKQETQLTSQHLSITTLREEVLKDRRIRPLYSISSCRTRFVGLNNGPNGVILATMDSNISFEKGTSAASDNEKMDFPFAVLQVRTEGILGSELLSLLNQSYLVERVRGFSLQYHALWQLYKPQRLAPPLWLPILNQDIRKLPPPAMRSNSGALASSSGTQSGTQRSGSVADGTTAVETTDNTASPVVEQLEIPPLRSFRKKRRRMLMEGSIEPQQKYWSEYDHPEDLEGDGDAYVIYIDPNEKSTFDRVLDKIGRFFSRSTGQEEEQSLLPGSRTPDDGETDSDEEATGRKMASYGTMTSHPASSDTTTLRRSRSRTPPFLPQISVICFSASVAILIIAYLLATTSKPKFATEVDAGVLFSIAVSLAFAIGGWVPLLTRGGWTRISYSLAFAILLVDAVCCGGLLAWMLG